MSELTFYDTEIAHALLELGRKCQDKGLAFIAVVNDDGDIAKTIAIPPNSPAIFRYIEALSRCAQGNSVNVDSFFLAVMKEARKTGHSSMILNQLGVPAAPRPARSKEEADA